MNPIEKINSFESACEAENLDPKTVIPDFAFFPEEDRQAMIDHAKLVIVVKAINRIRKFVADWSNPNQLKYTPWFDMRSSSVGGFSYHDYDGWTTGTGVGSRLCVGSVEDAEHVGTFPEFKRLYESYFVIKA
jgi:hypothetical protein